MTQNTEQNVRTRDAQIDDLVEAMSDEVWVPDHKSYCEKMILEAEARGAEEQRRKDGEGYGRPVYQWRLTPDDNWVTAVDATELEQVRNGYPDSETRTLYTRLANVAALEVEIASLKEAEQLARADAEASKARVEVLEGENNTLKTRVINAAENLLSIETPCMQGDNFAVTICSHFEDCEGEICDNGWHEGATKAYEEIKDAVLQHFRAALTREGGV